MLRQHGPPFLIGAIGNARWAGTPLAAAAGARGHPGAGIGAVFWGADSGEVTIRDNSGVIGPGRSGTVVPDGSGGLDRTITEHFARSMSPRKR